MCPGSVVVGRTGGSRAARGAHEKKVTGMIHALYLDRGRVHYRNRWVQTSHLNTERQFNRTIYGSPGKLVPVPQDVLDAGGEPNPLKNTSNTAPYGP